MKKISYMPLVAVVGLITSAFIAAPVFAETNVGVSANANVAIGAPVGMHGEGEGGFAMHGVFGTVNSISGTTLTVTSRMMKPIAQEQEQGDDDNQTGTPSMMPSSTATIYTVDAANATVYKNNATSSVSNIVVGDTVMIQGTITGTNIVATIIRDGVMPKGGPMMPWGGHHGMMGYGTSTTSTTPSFPVKGNGEPIVGGSITAINGNTITIKNGSNVVYTIDVSNATIVKGRVAATLSSVAVGDDVIVQGVVNGNAVTASSLVDSGSKDRNGTAQSGENASASGQAHGESFGAGFFGAIGGFFKHLFGF